MMSDMHSLSWKGFSSNITSCLRDLLNNKNLLDVSLVCEGGQVEAHQLVLSATSALFSDILTKNRLGREAVIYLHMVRMEDLENIVEFMYRGQVNIPTDRMNKFLQTAELLKVILNDMIMNELPKKTIGHFADKRTFSSI